MKFFVFQKVPCIANPALSVVALSVVAMYSLVNYILKIESLDLDVNSVAMIRASDVRTWTFLQIIQALQILVSELAARQSDAQPPRHANAAERWINEDQGDAMHESANRAPPASSFTEARFTQCSGQCTICGKPCVRILEEDPNHRHCRCHTHRRP